MTPKMRTLLGYLISVLGLTALLFAAVISQLLDRRDDSHFLPRKQPIDRSSIRFSEQRICLEPVCSGVTANGSVLAENIGNKIITNVAIRAGCICTGATLSATVMKPGESIEIKFAIDTKGKYEDFNERILFTYSEGGQNLFDVFSVSIPILTPGKLVAEPSSLQFNKARVGESFSKNIKLSLKDLPENESIKIIDVTLPDWLSADIIKQNADWNLALSGTFPNQSGRFVEFVQIKTNSTEHSEMIIPIIVEYATDTHGDIPSPSTSFDFFALFVLN